MASLPTNLRCYLLLFGKRGVFDRAEDAIGNKRLLACWQGIVTVAPRLARVRSRGVGLACGPGCRDPQLVRERVTARTRKARHRQFRAGQERREGAECYWLIR